MQCNSGRTPYGTEPTVFFIKVLCIYLETLLHLPPPPPGSIFVEYSSCIPGGTKTNKMSHLVYWKQHLDPNKRK
jgi:hypothetical protein